MTRGRPPRGLTSIDLLEGPEEERKRLKTILERVAGKCTVDDACAVLGIGRAYYYVLEKRVLNAAFDTLSPKRIGRPPEERPGEPPEVRELKDQVRQLQLALDASKVREQLWATMPDVAQRVLGKPLKGGTTESR